MRACINRIEIADLVASTSEFSSNLIGSGAGAETAIWGGCEWVYVCLPFWTGRAALNVGVMGETGGRTGDADRDFDFDVDVGECPSGREVLVGDDVSTVRDGMACPERMERHVQWDGG